MCRFSISFDESLSFLFLINISDKINHINVFRFYGIILLNLIQ